MFLRFDLGGSLLYVAAYAGAGYVFSRLLRDILRALETVGRAVEVVLILAAIGYVIYRFYVYWTHRVYRVVPRVLVDELIAREKAGEELVIVDVRSHGYYDAGTARIKGSIRLEPNNLEGEYEVALERKADLSLLYLTSAKRPAPGWRTCCEKMDLTRT